MRQHRGLAALGCLVAIGVAINATAQAPADSLLVSGQTTLAVIDADGDGPDSDDCLFNGSLSGLTGGNPSFATFLIQSLQSNTPMLRACQNDYGGSSSKGSDSSSNYASANFTSPALGGIPLLAEIVDETSNPNNGPVGMNDQRDYAQVQTSGETTLGLLCRGPGGPAAQLRLPSSPSLLVDLNFYPDAANPTHLEIPGPPAIFELAAGGFMAFNAYVPVTTARHITVSTQSAPNTFFVDINLDRLPLCGAGAPTLSGYGMILGSLLLMVLGALGLSRRDNFARALSF